MRENVNRTSSSFSKLRTNSCLWPSPLSTCPNSPAAPQKASFVSALGKAYEEVGFVAVKTMASPTARSTASIKIRPRSSACRNRSKENMRLPAWPDNEAISFGKEHAKGSAAPDLKRNSSSSSQTVEDSDPIRKEYPDNVTVERIIPASIRSSRTLTGDLRRFRNPSAANHRPLP